MALTPAERQRRHRERLQGPSEADFARALEILRRRLGTLRQTMQQAQTLADSLVDDLGVVSGD